MKKKNIKLVLFCMLFILTGFCPGVIAQTLINDGKTLTVRQQAIIPIAAFTASGDLVQLKTVLNEGLDAGLTINEIKEILMHIYAYAGFPRSLNGINTFMVVLGERERQGIKDVEGPKASPIPVDMDRNKYGEDVRTSLTGRIYNAPLQTFTPVMDQFLKEHLFADLFARDVLDHLLREIVTVSALTGLGGVDAQLRSHINICMNLGLSAEQMRNFIEVVKVKVNKTKAENAMEVLNSVIDARK